MGLDWYQSNYFPSSQIHPPGHGLQQKEKNVLLTEANNRHLSSRDEGDGEQTLTQKRIVNRFTKWWS